MVVAGPASATAATQTAAQTATHAVKSQQVKAAKPNDVGSAAICSNFSQTVSMSANREETVGWTQYWPGGTVTVGTAPCTVTVTRPSGRIDWVGVIGDPWKVSIPTGSQMQSANITNVALPNCTLPAAIPNVEANRPSCSVGWSAANFAPSTASMTFSATAQPVLTVSKSGTGSGTVTSAPSGISCGATCEAQFSLNTGVTLTATAAGGSFFQGWGGACSGGGTTCTVTMAEAKNVTATFAANPTSTLSVTKGGAGSGSVTSSPGGINCGATCSATFANGSIVTLTAVPQAGSTFAGWAGSCTGSSTTCNVTMNLNHNVVANFVPAAVPTPLTVAKSGTGTGTVTSSPAGINCGSTCSANFNSGSTVTLTAAPTGGSTFSGWSGGGCTGTGACSVTLNSATTVTATFAAAAATGRPDGLVGLGSAAAIGDGIYNSTGAKQTRATKVKKGKSATFKWVVQNDDATADTMTLSQQASGKSGFKITFKNGSKNVTKAVVAGTQTLKVNAGKSKTITVVVKAKSSAAVKNARTWLLKATSGNDPSSLDVVGTKVTVKK